MGEPKAIKAIFYNWRPVVGHKQLQLIFEVPIEETEQVLKLLGAPMPDKWCAIALMDMKKFTVAPGDEDISIKPIGCPQPAHKPEVIAKWTAHTKADTKRRFYDLPYPQQAGIQSEDLDFWVWISKTPIGKECETAADAIRAFCGVTSRKDIQPKTQAGDRWIELLRSYEERDR